MGDFAMSTERLIFTNGCFDILHVGHIELLEFAASHGKVVVGLNSDTSVRGLKGPDRPINNQSDRKRLLEALSAVDEVVIFDEETPYELIKRIKPDIIVKGGDYTRDEVVGSDLADVLIFPFVVGKSTTNVVNKIAPSERLES
jgi:D-beta-D-heptose 7-phosphate kinase/D-beta-D-heptose 1-phosphate adenosyltransferase